MFLGGSSSLGLQQATSLAESAESAELDLPYTFYDLVNHVGGSNCFASGPSSLILVFRARSRRFSPGVHVAGSRILHSVCLSRRLSDLGTCSFSGAFEHWSRASVQSFTSAAWGRERSRSGCFSASHCCLSSVPPGSKTLVRAKSCAHARFCKVTL